MPNLDASETSLRRALRPHIQLGSSFTVTHGLDINATRSYQLRPCALSSDDREELRPASWNPAGLLQLRIELHIQTVTNTIVLLYTQF